MKGVMSERLFFRASGMLPPMRSRPPARALPGLFNSHEGMSANELEQSGARQPCPQALYFSNEGGRDGASSDWGSPEPLSPLLGLSALDLLNNRTAIEGFLCQGNWGILAICFRSWEGTGSVMWVACSKC